MTSRPKQRRAKRTAVTTAKKTAAKTAAKRLLPTRANRVAMRAALASIAVNRKPLLEPIPCTSTPTMASGTEELDNAYTKQSPADMVILICYGVGLGLAVPVTWTKTTSGWSFEGWRPGCYVQKCSNGMASMENVFVAGTIDATATPQTLTFEYEHHALCGEELTCIETGNYVGAKISSGSELRQADWRGTMTWQRTCCPDREWRYSVVPPPPPAQGVRGGTVGGRRMKGRIARAGERAVSRNIRS